jgi:hypothetical protein
MFLDADGYPVMLNVETAAALATAVSLYPDLYGSGQREGFTH